MNTHHISIDFSDLLSLSQKPPLYAEGTHVFWQDPHIAGHLLEAHLDPSIDSASKKPETIKKEVGFITKALGLTHTHSILDLGCGPGLYCEVFAGYCGHVTGVDFSTNSIDYAAVSAREKGLNITYACMNYLELSEQSAYDMACMINYDFGALGGEDMPVLLERVRRALKPGGTFVFDVFTPARPDPAPPAGWYVSEGGFWHPGPHLVLERRFAYPEDHARLAQYIVLTPAERRGYRIYDTMFSLEGITDLLARHGFTVAGIYADLRGTALSDDTETLGIFARKTG